MLLVMLVVVAVSSACRSKDEDRPASPPRPPATLDVTSPAHSAKRLWLKQAGGAITDLSATADGSGIFVATAPDPDIKGNLKEYFLTRYNAAGKVIWRTKQRGQVKGLSVSVDGNWAIISNYLDDLTAYGPNGRVKWTAEAVCRPILLDPISKVLCFHDDDAEPQIAFDVFDLKGHKEFSAPTTRDVLALKVAEDASVFTLSQVEGYLILYSARDFKPLWERKVEGEILDLDATGGENPRVAVLYFRPKLGRRLVVIDAKGVGPEVAVEPAVRQIEWAEQGSSVTLYGNSQEGQTLVSYGVPAEGAPQLKWERRDSRSADYSSSALAGKQVVWMGFEKNTSETRTSSLLGYDGEGKLLWNLNLETEDGAYLYAKAFSEKAGLMAVGTDDGRLSLFKLTR